MDVNSEPQIQQDDPVKLGDGQANGSVNGVTNGFVDKHHSRDKHRERDKDRHRDKDKHSSSRDHHKDKDRHRDKDKDRSKDHKSSHRDKDHHSSDKHRSDKDKHRSDKEHKDKPRSEHRDKDKHRSEHRDKDKERSDKDKSDKERSDRHKSSSHKSSHHDKDKHKHSKDKPSGDASKEHKDTHKSDDRKDKHRSDKDKHRSDKHRDDKHKSSRTGKDEKKDVKKEEHHRSDRQDKHDRSEREIKAENDIKQEVKVQLVKLPDDSFNDFQNDGRGDESKWKHNHMNNISTASSCDYNYSQFKSEDEFSGMDENSRTANNFKQEVEEDSEEDKPIAIRTKQMSDPLAMDESEESPSFKRQQEDDGEDSDVPLLQRKKVKKETKEKKKTKKREHVSDDEDEYEEKKPKKKKVKTKPTPTKMNTSVDTSPTKKGGRKKKDEEEPEVWKWWEEKKEDDGTKWKFLEHKGPVFPPDYERIPDSVKFYYDGKEMRLSREAEEVAGFYARMLDNDYTSKEVFNKNFFKDWRKTMTDKEREKIKDLSKCNFKPMHTYFMDQSEKNRNRTKEEKLELKNKNAEMMEVYGFCTIDGHKERIGNFKIEPPGLFRGRGEHPRMGMLKKRVTPEEVIVNCSRDSKWPEAPKGHKWKEVRHDNSVTWLATWQENVQGQYKYVMLNPSSKLKGEKDWQKYETARRLAKEVDKIRADYQRDWKSKEMRIRQRAVAMYFIDKLALRAGNEKDEDQADTVGCCSLRVEHIQLFDEKDGKEHVVVFDFLGKDSIRYYNEVPVEKRVYKNLQLFMEKKSPSDDLFDRLNTAVLNKHLQELMDGLTAKVFRTYNASITLEAQLKELTNEDDSIPEKILSYNRANRAVAILCNHQRSVPKTHDKSMGALRDKIEAKREQIKDAERQVKDAKREAKHGSVKEKVNFDKKKKQLEKMYEQLKRLEVQQTDKDENKTIALGTSKLNYLDPRISIAWCKKFDVPIDKIFNKTQREKFRWAIDMAGPDYEFYTG